MPESPGIMTSRMASRGRAGLERLPGAAAPSSNGLDGIPGLGEFEHDEVADVCVVVGDEDSDPVRRPPSLGQLLRCSRGGSLRQLT